MRRARAFSLFSFSPLIPTIAFFFQPQFSVPSAASSRSLVDIRLSRLAHSLFFSVANAWVEIFPSFHKIDRFLQHSLPLLRPLVPNYPTASERYFSPSPHRVSFPPGPSLLVASCATRFHLPFSLIGECFSDICPPLFFSPFLFLFFLVVRFFDLTLSGRFPRGPLLVILSGVHDIQTTTSSPITPDPTSLSVRNVGFSSPLSSLFPSQHIRLPCGTRVDPLSPSRCLHRVFSTHLRSHGARAPQRAICGVWVIDHWIPRVVPLVPLRMTIRTAVGVTSALLFSSTVSPYTAAFNFCSFPFPLYVLTAPRTVRYS